MLTSWLRKDIKSITLLYRGTNDTGKAEMFHSLIDNHAPLLLMIETDKFGTIGAYTSITPTNKS